MAASAAPRRLEIAGLRVDVSMPGRKWPLPSFPLFLSADCRLPPHWRLEILREKFETPTGELLFDSGESWAAYSGGRAFFEIVQNGTGRSGKLAPRSLLRIWNEERRAVLFDPQGTGLSFPLDELFFLNAFSRTRRLFVHSCAVERHGRGILFCGVSGAGKSTLGKFLERAGWTVLCDERNVVTLTDNGPVLSSSPWYGSGEICRNGSAPLAGLVLLDPAHRGLSIRKMGAQEALLGLINTLFFPQFSRDGVDATMGTLERVLGLVPVHRLSYAKDSVEIADELEKFSQGYGAMPSAESAGSTMPEPFLA